MYLFFLIKKNIAESDKNEILKSKTSGPTFFTLNLFEVSRGYG
jgi:hypothetical protein